MQQNRREAIAIIIIIFITAIIGGLVVNSRVQLNYHYPDQFLLLEDGDFKLTWQQHAVQIGSTPGEEVMKQFPQGHMLGISTIFSTTPDNSLLFTFTEKDNIVYKAHIESADLTTSRGVRAGDSFNKAIQLYGESYAWVDAGQSEDFDAVYGSDNSRCIVFQVRNGLIQRIVLQNDPTLKQLGNK